MKESITMENEAQVISVEGLLNKKNLAIPHYQRPYRWTTENVSQLLEDIVDSYKKGKKQYRIGTVILHKNEDKLDIVDGQQRITTLLLILKVREENIIELKYNHHDSFENIKRNFSYIEGWLNRNGDEKLINYIKSSCEVVEIIVTNLSEAFQLFDTQNGRGKELLPYNLLKAYHIRAMELEPNDVKIACDKKWEDAAMYDATPNIEGDPNEDVLKQLFDEQLYRGRVWSKKNEAYGFDKSEIGEFKGFTLDKNHTIKYAYQNPQLLQFLTAKYYKNVLDGIVATQSRFEWGDSENIDPFVNINQQIVNGKAFFDYIETYVEIYKRLFIHLKSSQQLSEFKRFYYEKCLNYTNYLSNADEYAYKPKGDARRSGDTYLREAYKTIIFILFDKFGEKGLLKYYEVIYKLIYINRLILSQVRYDAVAKIPSKYIQIIVHAKELSDLEKLNILWADYPKKEDKTSVSGIERIKKFILDNDGNK